MTLAQRLLYRATRSRRFVLTAALAAGLAAGIATGPGDTVGETALIAQAYAQDASQAAAEAQEKARREAADAQREAARQAADAERDAAQAKRDAAEAARASRPTVDAEISIGERGVTIRKRNDPDSPNVVVGDMEFDSFEDFVEKAPWLAGVVLSITAFVFLIPVLIIALIVWYKMRTNRLRNETMLKLAERGVVAPADAIAAVGTPGGAALESLPATAPLYERARQVRKRAAWSDLRKGIVMLGIGLGLIFWSMLDEGTANGFGLILLFVGIGYIVLWYFEERQAGERHERVDRTPGGG